MRGGSWSYGFPRDLRAADRGSYATVNRYSTFVGFRVARTLTP